VRHLYLFIFERSIYTNYDIVSRDVHTYIPLKRCHPLYTLAGIDPTTSVAGRDETARSRLKESILRNRFGRNLRIRPDIIKHL
jgi:hypothetical protein